MSVVRLIARPMLATAFVTQGFHMLRHPGPRAERAAPLVTSLADTTGLPQNPELMVRVNGATMVGAGVMLATGTMPRVASALLAASLVPTTYVDHAYWAETDPQTRANQRAQFHKSVGLLGGALLASVDTAGKPGLVWRTRHAARDARRAAATEARIASAEAKSLRRGVRRRRPFVQVVKRPVTLTLP